MKLFYSPTSPFVRKVLVAVHELNLRDRLQLERALVSPMQPNAALARCNPLMKVPTLITEDGLPLFGSQVICEYLDSLPDTPGVIPRAGGEKWRVARLQALGDGILEAGLLLREDGYRFGERRNDRWCQGQLLKIRQGLDFLEVNVSDVERPKAIDLGQITVAIALGWLAFRDVVGDMGIGRPRLAAWYEKFAARPSMRATAPKEDHLSGSVRPD